MSADISPVDTAPAAKVAATPASPQGIHSLRSLCNGAQLSPPLANVVRVTLGIKRRDVDEPCDEAKFKAALASLNLQPEVK